MSVTLNGPSTAPRIIRTGFSLESWSPGNTYNYNFRALPFGYMIDEFLLRLRIKMSHTQSPASNEIVGLEKILNACFSSVRLRIDGASDNLIDNLNLFEVFYFSVIRGQFPDLRGYENSETNGYVAKNDPTFTNKEFDIVIPISFWDWRIKNPREFLQLSTLFVSSRATLTLIAGNGVMYTGTDTIVSVTGSVDYAVSQKSDNMLPVNPMERYAKETKKSGDYIDGNGAIYKDLRVYQPGQFSDLSMFDVLEDYAPYTVNYNGSEKIFDVQKSTIDSVFDNAGSAQIAKMFSTLREPRVLQELTGIVNGMLILNAPVDETGVTKYLETSDQPYFTFTDSGNTQFTVLKTYVNRASEGAFTAAGYPGATAVASPINANGNPMDSNYAGLVSQKAAVTNLNGPTSVAPKLNNE